MVLDRLLHLPQTAVGIPEVSEPYSFSAPVPDFVWNDQRLFMVLDRLLHLPQTAVGIPEVSEPYSFSTPITNLPYDRKRLFIILYGFLVVS